jgi:hypothetical protein
MIIKCPKCDNVFLAPDDLEEGQELKCGKCGYMWELQHRAQDIPGDIKPAQSSHIEDFKATEEKESNFLKGLIVFVLVIIIIGFSALHFKKQIIAQWNPSEKIFNIAKKESVSKNSLALENLRAVESGSVINLTGTIKNTTNKKVRIPVLIIADKFYSENRKKFIPANGSIEINTQVPNNLISPIKISF